MDHDFSELERLAHSADACERSWSMTAQGTEARVLFFFETSVEASKMIASAALSLGLPEGLLSTWSRALPGADAIGLALRGDGASVRVYTQYWEVLAARVDAGNLTPFPLYRGFKSLPSGVVRRDDYHCQPVAPKAAFWPPMAESFARFGLDPVAAEDVFADLTAETAICTRTMAAERSSWLTTVRRAELDRASLARWAAPLAERPMGDEIVEALRTRDLVHLAGGRDSEKGDFLTVYVESTPEQVLGALERLA
ncbi:hypothetical protein [Gymnodinialimonas ceratoperidinii]|uniref:Uncharacterized protein n=1 Tax=Gymnodinialimonas ceratoperidinii TaxID=2856823 RepID=A0A8F6TWZ4_9RHOB|nr:hypothetical protein [Gymnodinialimonas ceratoperidinii]QXT39468.1 hypothetical protein KYE46_16335 [Gymnodinialimonas ceratoperidinii]